MRKKLIEVALPLDAINAAGSREKSIRHGHPSTLHLWWARRPLAAARAVIRAQRGPALYSIAISSPSETASIHPHLFSGEPDDDLGPIAPTPASAQRPMTSGVISPTESLAFSMHANPGVYAVLVGSGVSRAAKIPTGWEITLDLVRKLAALRKEPCDPDPERWYRNTFSKEADYSDLLDALCGTAAERQQLLLGYIDPSVDDREEGAKQPTAAHRAIAALTATGFIRVILTTNFDRLIETALEEAGVKPAVLTTPDQLQGALPLIHTRCCVVKLHGDYLDTRIRNTQAELDSYSAEFDRLLDRVFDEFGLVVCGWSAAWDGALREALYRASSRRFTTYWAAHGEIEDEARRLIEHRGAESIPITDADEFFSTTQQHVESLQEFARPHPLSTEAAVASLKRYLSESRHRIRLSDLVEGVVERVVLATSGEGVCRGRSDAGRLGRHRACSPLRGGLLNAAGSGVRQRFLGGGRPRYSMATSVRSVQRQTTECR